jgi:acrylyl-CoA reductase (NADPH)
VSLPASFRAFYLDRPESEGGKPVGRLGEVPAGVLPAGDVTIRVAHTTVNYKDAMMVKGIGYRLKDFPFVPGIDLAGTVEDSAHPDFAPGDAVVLNGYGAGERFAGGFAEFARARGDGLIPIPAGWDSADCMAVGTAGMSAMIGALELEKNGIVPGKGAVLVTGASGGVGSMSIAILKAMGHHVIASTGRMGEEAYLRGLGAAEVVPRSEFENGPAHPMLPKRFAGCIDAVGGKTLSTIISSMDERGVIASCGLAGGNTFTASLIPFFLRGVRLIGVEGGHGPIAERREVWARLPKLLDRDTLRAMTSRHGLADIPRLADDILAGRMRGRAVVDVRG